MKVTSERVDNHKTILNLEIPQEEVAKALDRAYKNIVSKTNIPGFRKGKAPRKIIEARFGKKALLEEAFDLLAPKAYSDALTQEDIDPVAPPQIDVVTLEENQPLIFKATVVGKPKVVLGQYKELDIEKPKVEVTAEQVDNELERLRNIHAKMVPADENAELKTGDMAIIDFEGFIDGVAFEGGKGVGYPLQIGSGRFIPGFEDQLIGAKAGSEQEIFVTFPDNYPNFAGQEAKFIVKIEDIKCKELPALDDDFAKEVSDFETLEEYKTSVKTKLEDVAALTAEQQYVNTLVQTATDNSSFEVPDIMVENQLDGIIESMAYNAKMRGIDFATFLDYSKTTIQDLRDKNRESALQEVRTELVLHAIAKEEGLTVEAADIEEEAASLAAAYGTTGEDVLKATAQTNRMSALRDTVLRKKAAKLILDNAKSQ